MASPDLAVDADLTVERDGAEALRVSGDGAVVEVIIRSAGAALALARDAGLGSGTRRRMLSHAAGLLARGGLTAEVRVGAVLVARAGASVRAGIPRS